MVSLFAHLGMGCGLALYNVGVFTHNEASVMRGSQFELYIAWEHRKIVILHHQEKYATSTKPVGKGDSRGFARPPPPLFWP